MPHSDQERANLALIEGLYRDVLIAQDATRVDDYIAADYIQHSALAPPGREALKDWLRHIRIESPEAEQTVHRLIADDDFVVAHVHVRRWPGDRGLAVMDMYRIADGRVAEHWEAIQDVPEVSPNPTSMF